LKRKAKKKRKLDLKKINLEALGFRKRKLFPRIFLKESTFISR